MTATRMELVEAIQAIYRAPVYAEHKRENGISLELVDAIRAAAKLADIKQPDPPMTPQMIEVAEFLAKMEARGNYPKMEGDNLDTWLVELKALAAIERKDIQ